MPTKLKIKIAKHPSPAAALAAKEIHPSRRMLRAIFGIRRPQHRMAVLLPGSEASTVEVRVADTDDLMALADVAGVTREGGDNWACVQVVDGLFMRLLPGPLGVVRIRWGVCRRGWCGCGGGCRSLRSRWRPQCRPGRGW